MWEAQVLVWVSKVKGASSWGKEGEGGREQGREVREQVWDVEGRIVHVGCLATEEAKRCHVQDVVKV